jgi:hypothetical protein
MPTDQSASSKREWFEPWERLTTEEAEQLKERFGPTLTRDDVMAYIRSRDS